MSDISRQPSSAGVPSSVLRPLSAGYLSRSIGLRTAEEQAWGKQNGLTGGIPFSHALDQVFPPELHEEHPEFFPLVDGRRFRPAKGNYYWNPDLGREDVARYAAEQAKIYFDKNPRAVSFALGVNDGLVFGESPETLAWVTPTRWFRERPDYSALVFTFMNRAAEELSHTHPDKYLGALAYYWCENAPPFPVHPQVVPFLTADRSQSYDPAFKEEEFDLQRRWAVAAGRQRAAGGRQRTEGREQGTEDTEEKSDVQSVVSRPSSVVTAAPPRLGLYDYLDGYGFLVPRVPIRAFAEHIKHAHAVGFTDYYGESSRNWGLDGPYPWVIAQLLRDPSLDVDALLEEYYRRFFQGAAQPMRRFFERCEEQWMRQSGPSYWLKYYRSEAQAVLFPEDVCAELRSLLDRAADQANTARVRQRVAFVADSFGVTERFVRLQRSRETLTAVLLRDRLAENDGRALLQSYLQNRREFIRYTYELRARSPLSFYPLNFADWLRNDPTFAAALALAADRGQRTEDRGQTEDVGRRTALRSPHLRPLPSEFKHPAIASGRAAADATLAGRSREILPSGSLSGPLTRGRRIAGLQYRLDLPSPWQSLIEPTQHVVAELRDDENGGRFLRLTGNENATVYQWLPAQAGRVYLASVAVRGRVSPSDAVMLTLGWLDAHHRPIGKPTVMRLPDGEWPDWVTLCQGGTAPANAKWVGIDIRVQHQVAGDWAEFDNFSLLEFGESNH